MSWGTDVILLLNLDETWVEDSEDFLPEETVSEALNAVNTWLKQHGHQELINLSEGGSSGEGGRRPMLSLVYGGAFSRLDDEEFAPVVLNQRWRSPGNVQLLLKPDTDERYTLYTVPE